MTSATAQTTDAMSLEALRITIDRKARGRRMAVLGTIGVLLAYITISFIQFDLGGIARKWNPTNAAIFILDSYAYKDHVTMDWRKPENVTTKVSYEGGHRFVYDPAPDWYADEGDARIVSFDSGAEVALFDDHVELIGWPTRPDELFVFRRDETQIPYVVGYESRPEDLPEGFRVTKTKVEIRSSDLFERIQVYKSKVEIHRYQVGWAFFWFDFDSPLAGNGFWDAVALSFSDERVVPEMSNVSLALSEFWDNAIWQHSSVIIAMVETVFMALLGTMLASLVGLPLAFFAARNVMPLSSVRFGLRRLFDFLRGVDTLIWSLIFLRAFGPGMFTGIFAIAFTDTGTLGKLMSEAIENSDQKQQEGVKSTGANKIQQHCFGVLPQIMPVFISQSLYYLESNTRSAVVIGAMGAGGIGLLFIKAAQTGSSWENVAYMAILVLLVVIAMDAVSARLRRALIGIDKSS